MGQRIEKFGTCCYCTSCIFAVYYRGMYLEDKQLLEVHCNKCLASWEPDENERLIPRMFPSEEKLRELGVLEDVIELGLRFVEGSEPKWAREVNQKEEEKRRG